MKDWIKRWLNTKMRSERDVYADLVGEAFRHLEDAQKAHISDLRVLLDKGHAREEQLARMVQMAVEHQFYRPEIRTTERAENKIAPPIPAEQLGDVAVFDEQQDQELMKEQQSRFEQLNKELQDLTAEQNSDGINKVEA